MDLLRASKPSLWLFDTEHKIAFADIGASFCISAFIFRIDWESSFESPSKVSIFVRTGCNMGIRREGCPEDRPCRRDCKSSSIAWSKFVTPCLELMRRQTRRTLQITIHIDNQWNTEKNFYILTLFSYQYNGSIVPPIRCAHASHTQVNQRALVAQVPSLH